jgi:hypothetical protein
MIGSSFSRRGTGDWISVFAPGTSLDPLGNFLTDRGERLFYLWAGDVTGVDETFAFNSPLAIPDLTVLGGGIPRGEVTAENLVVAYYNGTPTVGDVLGPKSGEHYLDASGYGGFRFVAAVSENDDGSKIGIFERVWHDIDPVPASRIIFNNITDIELTDLLPGYQIGIILTFTPVYIDLNAAGDVIAMEEGTPDTMADYLSGTACPP